MREMFFGFEQVLFLVEVLAAVREFTVCLGVVHKDSLIFGTKRLKMTKNLKILNEI